jgi:membrane protein DedA with SNARE-associated domain
MTNWSARHVSFKQPAEFMNQSRLKMWLPLALIAAALLIWAAFFALGSYLQIGADHPRHDLRKPLIIMATMAIFLALWGLALWLRERR